MGTSCCDWTGNGDVLNDSKLARYWADPKKISLQVPGL
jgi:hypothetical protein